MSARVRHGIKTDYSGVQFRSRIEARWASFFDQMDWRWTYEPFDLDGYIPDFVLEFHKPLLVEVKSDGLDLDMAKSKIECSGWDGEAMVVNGCWPVSHWHDSMPAIGELAERHPDPDGDMRYVWGGAQLFECLTCRRVSLFHADMIYACRVNGCYDGDHHMAPVEKIDPHAAWKLAGNRVRWRPK